MTKIAIVGSRDFQNAELVEAFVERLPAHAVVVSGGARGVDRWAEDAARHRDLEVEIFPADWERYGKSAGFRRNKDIVQACQFLVGFWDGKSRGTLNSLDLALAANKLFMVFLPDGRRLTADMFRAYRQQGTSHTSNTRKGRADAA